MTGALLALFNRSVRQDVRAKSTYWARAGLVAMISVMMVTTHISMGWAGAPGLRFFGMVISTNYLFISLAGLSFFSSAITEEKEEMTLGLLRMTNLNPLSILLGKSTSRLFNGLLLLAVQLPFTLLAVSFGGVSLTQILAAYCALMAYVVFLSNVALLASVICTRTAGAAVLTGFILVLFLFGPYLTIGIVYLFFWMGFISSATPGASLEFILAGWNSLLPATRFHEVMTTGFNDGVLCPQVYGNLALGALFFGLAWAGFDFFCLDQKDAAPRRGLLFRAGSKTRGPTSLFRLFGAGRPWKAALVWKDFYFMTGGRMAVFIKLAIYGLLPFLAVTLLDPDSNRLTTFGFTYVWAMAGMLVAELIIIAGRVFRQERRWQTLSSLVMLPISIRRLAYQKVLGASLGCWPALFFFLLGWSLVLIANWADFIAWWNRPGFVMLADVFDGFEWHVVCVIIGVVALALFFLHLVVDLSLRFKWGAVPLALAITWLLNMIALPLAGISMGEASFVAVPMALIAATIFLHVRIGLRLEQLAGEE